MKKMIILLSVFLAALYAQAATIDATASYVYSSDFNQVRAGASIPLGLNASVGLQGKYVNDKISENDGGFKDPVYSVYLPIGLDLDLVQINLTPFYYFKNASNNPLFQDASAYGINTQFMMNLVADEVEDRYTQAYVGVSYAHQKGSLLKEHNWSNENYSQLAYTLGVRQNFYGAFAFQASASAYQYPDGIEGVENFRGVLDQNDLAFTQSYDVSRALGKYALSARITRMWAERHSTLYAGYHFAEFYTADPQHSVIVGNSFYVASPARLDAAYNHLQTTNGKNKRDIFYINLNIAF